VRVGDRLLVRPGDRIPVDGSVLDGGSFVDESSITGESMPVEKKSGSAVYAGTINQSGAMEIEVGAVGLNTNFGKIIEIVENAERSKAPIQKTADRLAGYLVLFRPRCRCLDIDNHAQHTLHHFSCHRGGCVWNCGRHTSCDSGVRLAEQPNWAPSSKAAYTRNGLGPSILSSWIRLEL
jgi:hypothetical protein